MHYTPYNLVRFYVGEITGTTPQTVKIYTDSSTSVGVQVSEDNKWYSYVLPKGKGLYKIEGNSVKKIVAKADIVTEPGEIIIPSSTVEASFKGSNTSNVTDMNGMFYYCRALTSLDVSSFDTSNVTDMNSMFNGCRALTSLDLRNFNTSNVTNMNRIFASCINLTSLDLSNFNTSNVTSMYNMFYGCSGLTSLDLSGWVIGYTTSMSDMFRGCVNLKTITMIGCGQTTIDKIKAQLTEDNITGFTIVTE